MSAAMQDGACPELPVGAADAEVVDLLRRAASLQRLARCFAYPAPGHHATVLELLGHASDDGPLATLVAAWHGADEDAMRVAYSNLFLASTPCPPNETAWGDARRLTGAAAELADIQGFYRAFGFDLADDGRDMPDHLCAELEFVSALLVKTAYARMQGWHEADEVAANGARSFLESHLGRWIGAFVERLRALGAAPPYREAEIGRAHV